MTNVDKFKKILSNELLPEKVTKELLVNEKHEISAVVLPSERVIKLYGLRLENNISEAKYENVNKELTKVIAVLKHSDPQNVSIITISSTNIYFLIFADENLNVIIGILDMTDLGDTKKYTESLF